MANISFIRIESPQKVGDYLFEAIKKRLDNGDAVLWLVAGGSAMDVAVDIAKRLTNARNLDLLTITLTDERYGPAGHSDSNWKQLVDKGFSLPGARLVPVLKGKDRDATAKDYSGFLDDEVSSKTYSIALAGMGPDGHIFGIKPGSPSVDSPQYVSAYMWDDYDRITPTIRLIKRLDEVVIYAAGKEKHQQLDDMAKELEPGDQPAQLLKQLKAVTIFNDYLGGSL